MRKDRIAIIGVGCRFPGNISDTDAFWKFLVEGRDAVSDIPPDRWNIARFYDPEPGIAGKSVTKRGGFIDGIDLFDAQFFGISPREAPYIDPQQRLMLETAWEAIEDAGMILDFENGSDLAVFVGISHNEYQSLQGDFHDISPHSPTGTAHSIAANRISYCLNLRGPSVALDTACSSAMTAVHAACEHIRNGRGDAALAGGVTVMITPSGNIGFSQATMLSPDGRCAVFDASASGFVRAEGAGMVLLKRLSRALADGDPIQGVILGTAINQDGHTNGISLPSPEAQARLVLDACRDAGVRPEDVGFVEAHGTGTAVGDPIEAHALAEALCANRPADAPLPIGSVKTNLGHLETAAGVPGLLKAMLVLKHGQIPPSLHFETPNPHIDFSALKLRVPTAVEPFPQSAGERIAGVNSFGFGGSNAHAILAEPPAQPRKRRKRRVPSNRPWPIVLSARSDAALKAYAGKFATWLDEKCIGSPGEESGPEIADLVYTLGARRNHHAYRLALLAQSPAEAVAELEEFAKEGENPSIVTAFAPRPEHPLRVGFVCSGQGPQWWGMGRELMEREAVFRETMERCVAALEPWVDFSLMEELARPEEQSRLLSTEIAQPAIFAMQVSLAQLWKSWGVAPAAIVGHSVGEVAAACIAGIYSIEDAARIVALRARRMEECGRGVGGMLAVGLDANEAAELIARHDPEVTISAYNGPRSLSLSGLRSSLLEMERELAERGVFARMVRVDHPFHHAMMQMASDMMEGDLAGLVPADEAIPFFSTITGGRCAGGECDGSHWARGIRQAVLFEPAVAAMAENGIDVWLELSAQPALARAIQDCLAGSEKPIPVVSSTRREREHDAMLEAAMKLHLAGVSLDFKGMTPSRQILKLPSYAWDKTRYWNELRESREARLGPGGIGLLDSRLARAKPTWSAHLDARHMAYLKDHRVDERIVFPGAAFVEMALEAGRELFEGRPFAIEDFEIRKPLILSGDASDVLLEITYSPVERTFEISSRLKASSSWSQHVVGSMRSERTESNFAESVLRVSNGLQPRNLDEFYQQMAERSLRYGDEFKPLRELASGRGHAMGRVALSEKIAHRAGEYALHPVLLDGAMHVFSSGAHALESEDSRTKLPVRFSRILYLGAPGKAARVLAKVTDYGDEFLEGDIEIYDDAGKPCVLVEGLRAVAVAEARSAANARDVIYHVDWERTPASEKPSPILPMPLRDLCENSRAAIDQVLASRETSRLRTAPQAFDDLAMYLLARGLRQMGVRAGQSFSAESLGVSEPMQRAFACLMQGLAKRRLMKPVGSGWKAYKSFEKTADAADDALRRFIEQHPGSLPEGLLCKNSCSELGPILRGEKDAVQVLFSGNGAELLEHLYSDAIMTSHWLAAIGLSLSRYAESLPEGRGLRILEIGAGTGGLAAQVLPQLERGLHSYVFSDVSPAFFAAAAQKLARFPEVEFKALDLERPGVDQEFEPESFDFILGTNVVHAVRDVRETIGHLHEMLAPGGTLFFLEMPEARLWTQSIFGLTSGWWRFEDHDLRPDGPLLGGSVWETVLREAGFAEVASLSGRLSSEGPETQIGMFAQKALSTVSPAEMPELEVPEERSWLLVADRTGVADAIADQLAACGIQPRIVQSDVKLDAEGWLAVLGSCGEELPRRIVYCRPIDATVGGDFDFPADLNALLELTHALDRFDAKPEMRVNLITRGAQPAGRQPETAVVSQGPVTGLFKVLLSERTDITWRAIDLAPNPTSGEFPRLWKELLSKHREPEVALRDEARYIPRLERGLPVRDKPLVPGTPLRLESSERGHLDTLKFVPFTIAECGPGEVLIDVKAGGMNFRDVLKALAIYPGEAPDARIFGDEVAGTVIAVGKDVTHVAPGDKVFGLAAFGLATQTLARGGDVRRMPDRLSFEEAATLPVVFLTAWHSLENVARIRKGETVLVHAGAGGVGMAAIQIAQHMGARVIASAGSPAKRELLKTLGVDHVIDSRLEDFTEAVMTFTGGRGVDCVINALAGEAIPMGMACLAEFGRFIEIGKRDIYQNSRIPLWPLRKNASFHVVAMDSVFFGDEALTRDMLASITNLVEKGVLHPLPFRAFPASRVDAAFQLMASGRHIGKVLISFAEPFLPSRAEPLAPGFNVRDDGAYVITGGFGGFGKVLAGWLADSGARELVLTGRSGARTEKDKRFVEVLRERGVIVHAIAADISKPAGVARALGAAKRPVRGIFHLAMVLDDAPLFDLTPERMSAVVEPKARGAWLLHQATRDTDLDCFVMFSSASSVLGNASQGNYSAANSFLDSLAYHRRALGLPSLTVNWGALIDEGYVAENQTVAEFLERRGSIGLNAGEATKTLQMLLRLGIDRVMATRTDWAKARSFNRSLQDAPLLERIFASLEDEEAGGPKSDWRNRIDAASDEDKPAIVSQAVRSIVGGVLRVKPDSLRDDQPLTDLGLDSLMGVEIEIAFESELGVALPPSTLVRARTIGQVAAIIAENLGAAPIQSTALPTADEAASEDAAEVDLEALSDDQLDRLLGTDAETDTLHSAN